MILTHHSSGRNKYFSNLTNHSMKKQPCSNLMKKSDPFASSLGYSVFMLNPIYRKLEFWIAATI